MGDVENIVDVQVNTLTPGVERAGFGKVLILSGTANFGGPKTKTYGSLEELAADFPAGTPEYLQGRAVFAQRPRPSELGIAQLTAGARPVMRWSIGVVQSVDATNYRVSYNGTVYTFLSVTAVEADILAGIAAMLNAADGNSSASVVGSAVVMVLSTAGDWKDLHILPPDGSDNIKEAAKWLSLTMDAVEPATAWATELASIRDEDDSWYWPVHPWPSKALNLAIAAYTETIEKFAMCETPDTASITAAAGGTDVMQAAETLAYRNSALIYHSKPSEMVAAAAAGKLAALDPGSYTAKFRQLRGCTGDKLTTTHTTNVKNKHGNRFSPVLGVSILQEGYTPSGEFIDVIHGIHWFMARVRENTFRLYLDALKVPFDDAGFALVEAELRGVIEEGESFKFFSDEEDPLIIMPRAVSATPEQRAARDMPPIEATIKLAGAVHFSHLRASIVP